MKEVVRDKRGNSVYLTDERWMHIVETHEEMGLYRDHVLKTIRTGKMRQDPFDPRKYKYTRAFDDLPPGFTHLVAVVRFETKIGSRGRETENNFVLTAYPISQARG